MYPVLFGPIKTYGFFLALAFLVGTIVSINQAKKIKIPEVFIYNLIFASMIFSIIGARGFYILLNFNYYTKYPMEIFKVWEGGLVFYGGLIAGIITFFVYSKVKKINFFLLLDIFSPSIVIGYAIGRIGCFFAGCCYGKPTDLLWGVTFTNPQSLVPPELLSVKLHPTQLYSSFFGIVIFSILFLKSKNKNYNGQIFLLFLTLYSIYRFFIEFLRDDNRGPTIFGLSSLQIISLFIFVFSSIWMIIKKMRT